jgi:hypothetical protein
MKSEADQMDRENDAALEDIHDDEGDGEWYEPEKTENRVNEPHAGVVESASGARPEAPAAKRGAGVDDFAGALRARETRVERAPVHLALEIENSAEAVEPGVTEKTPKHTKKRRGKKKFRKAHKEEALELAGLEVEKPPQAESEEPLVPESEEPIASAIEEQPESDTEKEQSPSDHDCPFLKYGFACFCDKYFPNCKWPDPCLCPSCSPSLPVPKPEVPSTPVIPTTQETVEETIVEESRRKSVPIGLKTPGGKIVDMKGLKK